MRTGNKLIEPASEVLGRAVSKVLLFVDAVHQFAAQRRHHRSTFTCKTLIRCRRRRRRCCHFGNTRRRRISCPCTNTAILLCGQLAFLSLPSSFPLFYTFFFLLAHSLPYYFIFLAAFLLTWPACQSTRNHSCCRYL